MMPILFFITFQESYKLSLIQRGKESREKLVKMGVLSPRQKMELDKYKNRKVSTSKNNLNDTRRIKDEEETMMQEKEVSHI
jgi:5-bromo-4-chloroindolyl phosphate hydrolysis protein